MRRTTTEEKIFSKVEKTGSCWLWTGCLGRGGYGRLGIEGRLQYAHRASFVLAFGSIPDGLDVLHTCDNPRCVRPSHLFLGTHQDNMRDRNAKRRHAHGERLHTAKLRPEQVLDIRGRYRFRDAEALAHEFGVSVATITNIAYRQTWRHL